MEDKPLDPAKLARCALLIDFLGIKFKHKKEWGEDHPRCETPWGTKTRLGLQRTIYRFMFEEEESKTRIEE